MSGRDDGDTDPDDGGGDGSGGRDPDPFVFDAGAPADPDPDPDSDREAPLGDLARDVERRRASGDDAATDVDFDDLFADESVQVDEDVWESLAAAEADGVDAGASGSAGRGTPEVDDDVDRVPRDDPDADRADHVVPKRSYCERCPYFASPPQVRCTHDGSEIVELPDFDHFRVRGCPMVEHGGPSGHLG